MTFILVRNDLIRQLEITRIELQKVIERIDKLEYNLYIMDESNQEPPDCEQCGRPMCICNDYEEVEYVG